MPFDTHCADQRFSTTNIRLVEALRTQDTERSAQGIGYLYEQYGPPIYAYLRRSGLARADAEDVLHAFFERLNVRKVFQKFDAERGRFRPFLLAKLKSFHIDWQRHKGAQKRGGQVVHVPLEGAEEIWEGTDIESEATAEAVYDRQWATDLVAQAVEGLQVDYQRRGRLEWFKALQFALPGGGSPPPYAELAAKLGCGEGTIKKAVFDLRNAFAARLKTAIRSTVRTNCSARAGTMPSSRRANSSIHSCRDRWANSASKSACSACA